MGQYGQDYLAVDKALNKLQKRVKGSHRKRDDDGRESIKIAWWPENDKLYPQSDPKDKEKM